MKKLRIISVVLLCFVAVNAVAAGSLFIVDPSGSKLGMGLDWLKYSPFEDFLIPGIVLFVFNGLLNILAASGVLFNWRHYSDLVIIQGMVLMSWIMLQVILLQDINLLHYLFAVIGFVLMVCGIRIQQMLFNK